MAYSLHWYVPNKIILLRYSNEVTVEDVRSNSASIEQMIDSATQHTHESHFVHTLIDLRAITKPLSLMDTPKAVRGMKPHPRSGWIVAFGNETDKVLRFAANLGRQLLRLRYYEVNTLDEARVFLQEVDAEINWSQADEQLLVNSPYNP